MQDDVALYETDGPVAIVTMNRPQKRNALSSQLKARLVELLKEAEADENIAVLANCSDIPHDKEEIIRLPFDDPKFPYKWF